MVSIMLVSASGRRNNGNFDTTVRDLPVNCFACLIVFVISLFVGVLDDVRAEEFAVRKAETTLIEGVYYLNTLVDYSLSNKMLDALHNGVSLTFEMDIDILRTRDYWVDETVASLEQRYQLEYQALTQQYLIRNLNSGALYYFPSLEIALQVLETVIELPIIDKELLDDGEEYTGRLRVLHDVDMLPVPLMLRAYVSSGWRYESGWFSWLLQR